MKKALMILLGVALVFSMAGIGTAADVSLKPSSGSPTAPVASNPIPVYYEVSESYEVTIPSDMEIGTKYNVGLVSAAVIDQGNFLNVYVNSTNGWYLKELVGSSDDPSFNRATAPYKNPGHSVQYSMTIRTLIYTDLVNPAGYSKTFKWTTGSPEQCLVYTSASGIAEADADITFAIEGTERYSGYYRDRLTFTVMIENAGDTQNAFNALHPV